jgi:hypothetical protein
LRVAKLDVDEVAVGDDEADEGEPSPGDSGPAIDGSFPARTPEQARDVQPRGSLLAAAVSCIFPTATNWPRKRGVDPRLFAGFIQTRSSQANSSSRLNLAGRRQPAFARRWRVVFGSGPSGRGLVMGHFMRGSKRIVGVQECPVPQRDRGNQIAFALFRNWRRRASTAAGPALTGILRHLIVRTTARRREAVAMLVVTANDKALRKPVRALPRLERSARGPSSSTSTTIPALHGR